MLTLSSELRQSISKHVLAEYPNEACGLIVAGKYISCKNTAEEPKTNFRIAAEDYAEAIVSGSLQAVVHSHPFATHPLNPRLDPRTPSATDQQAWIDLNVPFVIVNTNGESVSAPLVLDDDNPSDLIGRDFIHGYQDCYAIVRDYYRTRLGIVLPKQVRGWEWWATEQTLYEDNWQLAGFVEVPLIEAQVNDVVLFKVASKTTNHAAVITAPDEILHHLFYRPSGRDNLSKWHKQIVRVIRYADAAKQAPNK
ncbi:C40 family peptidase [Zoogloea sp.]|uniref:C40 family peptidase n=1 Tax=Zoogloea sp. TaxID=49181 RepID=UPI00141615E9|nr:MAG: hypothetical protein F9K15_02435 [Zoogloea sp.]